MKNTETPVTIHLEDYRPPAFKIQTVRLEFDLDPGRTRVRSILSVQRNPEAEYDTHWLLYGESLELQAVKLNGENLSAARYEKNEHCLIVHDVPDHFELEVVNVINPKANSALEGLYLSSGNFCTQCEAEGFRKITYYPDRPDVMARFFVTIRADKTQYPVLLSNGNLVAAGDLEENRHWTQWEDPYPKPSYLFALVAGQLVAIEDHYRTASGRNILLQIYVQPHNREKCAHAMTSLKNAMRWDEETFGLEYDLDRYMIVAVDDFNMGAMENKGLNVFNSKYVLAQPETATDQDYQNIEGVIGHEYFHNWTGNRVTCRDWFQLSLKEGLTVFRDQEFSSDMSMRVLKRISDVRTLRTVQFAEDAGPMAHPVRPDSYIEINNFYTVTIYEKGAEVIRMQHTLLGKEGFRKGMNLYFQRHDGQAVTTDDFVAAMEDANGVDLQQFRLWYTQAGTPRLHVTDEYLPEEQIYRLMIRQSGVATPNQANKEPMHIPVAIGLIDAENGDLRLTLDNGETAESTLVLNLKQAEQTFTFTKVARRPVPSLLRDFSAPVILEYDYSDEDLLSLQVLDNDSFNRWEASQRLAMRVISRLMGAVEAGHEMTIDTRYLDALENVLEDRKRDSALLAEALTLPSELYIAEQNSEIKVDVIHTAREFLLRSIATRLKNALMEAYYEHADTGAYRIDPNAIGRRSLKNVCLFYLMQMHDPDVIGIALSQYRDANNMTDVLAALKSISNVPGAMREDVLDDFYQQWRDEKLVVDKWLLVQALSKLPDTLDRVKALMEHPAFSIKNPNNVYSLVGAFSAANLIRFHAVDGAAYHWLADTVMTLDGLNPQVAARMVGVFNRWRRFDDPRQSLMKAELERIVSTEGLSRAVYEIVSKSLNA